MKTLTLVRHAKSDWGHAGLLDIDRPLSQRGYDDAYAMSAWFKEHFPIPELMVTSTAIRNLSTSFIFARQLGYDETRVSPVPAIYECRDKVLLDIIAGFDNAYKDIMLFAHNATITNVCNELSSDLFFEDLPTCAVVRLDFDIKNWQQTQTTKGKTVAHRFPKNFRQD
ncbi:MAG: histidine phosphatase family protein [Bacteroidetes bacterium]|nr:histidine phosphatase family protein [Bacteroidota bacterium]